MVCGSEYPHDVMTSVGHMDIRQALRLDVVLDQSVRAHITSMSVMTGGLVVTDTKLEPWVKAS